MQSAVSHIRHDATICDATHKTTNPYYTLSPFDMPVKRIPMLSYQMDAIWRTLIIPRKLCRYLDDRLMSDWDKRPDANIIRKRVDYYCPLHAPFTPGPEARPIRDIRLSQTHSAYWYDLMRYLRGYDHNRRISLINGDTHHNPEYVTFGKARRLDRLRDNVILMNLDRRRHFMRVTDPVPFEHKKPVLLFRGDVDAKQNRRLLLEKWWGHPLFDLGDTSPRNHTIWHTPRIPIDEHFGYRYILAPEGHDVASALQWICASGCVPVMTRPTVEGWLMHGAMIPGEHYIEIADDFSDAADKIRWYNANPEKAHAIAKASRRWAAQFDDPTREAIIHHLIVRRYLDLAME